MKNIVIFGATSAIAEAAALHWAKEKANLFLVARSADKLKQVADNMLAQGATSVHTKVLDVSHAAEVKPAVDACFSELQQVETVLVAFGSLPEQAQCEQDEQHAMREFTLNATTTIGLLTLLAQHFEKQKFGTIAVISSVAGDRGRPSNYLYGSAKAAVSTYCEGLRARMFKVGVNVLEIRPGMVNTPMTAGMDLPAALTAEPEQVGRDIVMAVRRKKQVVYTPGYWFIIMTIIKCVPRFIFNRANL